MADHVEPFDNGPAQGDMFAEYRPDAVADYASYRPDPALVNSRLNAMLCGIRACDVATPHDVKEFRNDGIIFHQMANWLPEEERDSRRLLYVRELERLNIQMDDVA